MPQAPGPSSESLQRRKPRLGYEGTCRWLYRDLIDGRDPRILTAKTVDRNRNFRRRYCKIGESNLSTSCNFKELHVAKRSHIQLSRYPALFVPSLLVRLRPVFHPRAPGN